MLIRFELIGTLQFNRFLRELNDKNFMGQLAARARELIYRRVKSGKGVNRDDVSPLRTKEKSLKPLSDWYIEYRKKHGELGRFGTPRRSNLTFSGQMLDAMEIQVNDKGQFRLFINENTRDGESLTNREVAARASKERPFFALTEGEFRILNKMVEQRIIKLINKHFGG